MSNVHFVFSFSITRDVIASLNIDEKKGKDSESDAQMLRCSDAQMLRCSDDQMHR
jgi:hypothetical protein